MNTRKAAIINFILVCGYFAASETSLAQFGGSIGGVIDHARDAVSGAASGAVDAARRAADEAARARDAAVAAAKQKADEAARLAAAAAAAAAQQRTNLTNQIGALQSQLNTERSNLDSFSAQLDSKRRNLVDLDAAILELKRQAGAGVSNLTNTVRNEIASVRALGDQELVIYDVTTPLELTYNARTGLAWYKLILPKGVRADSAWVKAALQGRFSPPGIDAVAFATQNGFVDASTSDTYNSFSNRILRSGNPETNSYIASKRFVDNISLESAGSDAVEAIFSGGASLKTSAEEKAQLLLLEWADIVSWLKNEGVSQAEEIGVEAINEIYGTALRGMTGNFVRNLNGLRFDIDVRTINYEYKITPKIVGGLGDALKSMSVNWQQPVVADVYIPHPIFTITIHRRRKVSVDDAFSGLLQTLRSGPTYKLESVASVPELSIPFNGASVSQFEDYSGDGSILGIVRTGLGRDVNEFKRYYVGNLTFDLSSSQFARRIERSLSVLAIGNEHEAHIRELSFNGETFAFTIKLELRHRHSLGKASDVLQIVQNKEQELGNGAQQRLNDINGRIAALETERGKLLASISDLANRLIPGSNAAISNIRQAAQPVCRGLAIFGERPPLCSA